MENDKRYEAGIETMEKMFPTEVLNEMKKMKEVSPDLWDMIVKNGFGDIYSRKTLSMSEREIITLTTLITQGAFEQLGVHLRAALKIGMTKEDIVEIIIQLTAYVGYPKAIHAMQIASSIFEE